ncbi:MAG: OmpH family outer membrane protein [Elusimicrobia bacterium]|nr:OmpH family outer membrane protein [Elusimicrobiota bacterium]
MKRISLLFLCAALTSVSIPSRAIELSLEENRAERGSVGFVDMRRLFAASPDATRAREGLEELVRQAEERVNAKKAELLRLRQDLGTIKIEREELAKSTPTASVPLPAPAPVKAPPPSKAAEAPKPAPKPAPAVVDATPVTALPPDPLHGAIPLPPPAASTQAAPAPLTINLPGLTDGPLNLERPGVSPLNPTRDRGTPQAPSAPIPPVVVSTPAAPAPGADGPAAVVLSTAPAAPVVPAGPTLAQRLLEFDGRIVAMQGEIDRQQGELDRERLGSERTLLDAEGRKTDQVLARLYRAISEVAKREGVSVVVDKSATLYGHPAVDLTDKVLKQLRGAVPAQ